MSSVTYVKQGGVQRRARQVFVKQNGVQRSIRRIYVKTGGVQRLVFVRGFELSIDEDTTDYKVYDQLVNAGYDEVTPIDLVVTNAIGVFFRATTTGIYAIDFQQSLPLGSTVRFDNFGIGQGKGGAAGNGGTQGAAPTAGLNGGPVMRIFDDITIDTRQGYLLSGGGGGGGGGHRDDGCGSGKSSTDCSSNGGGGGGGAGTGAFGIGQSSNNGNPGTNILTSLAYGTGGPGVASGCCSNNLSGPGGRGGDWGENGQVGGNATVSGAGGGLAGICIQTNGFTVTWVGGLDLARVKGAIV